MAEKNKDEVQIAVRMPRDLREEFERIVHGKDDTAARLIRQFMRRYIIENGGKADIDPNA